MRHTLKLDFAGTGRVDPRITVTRAGEQTYFDAFGVMRTAPANTLAIDHDPVTNECLGASILGASTNMFTYSEDFSNASWAAKSGVTVTVNAMLAPDNALTADKLVETSAAGQHFLGKTIAVSESTQYVGSFYVKAGERTRCSIIIGGSDWSAVASMSFDLVAGSVVSGVGAYGYESCGDGVYRLWVSGITGLTDVSRGVLVQLADNTGALSYTGDGTSGIYIWGAQFEPGSSPSPYMPTTSAQVTRPATVAKIDGLAFTHFYNPDEGTFVASFRTPITNEDSRASIFNVNKIATTESISARVGFLGTRKIRAYGQNAADSFEYVADGTTNTSEFGCIALAYKAANDFALCDSGGVVVLDDAGALDTASHTQLIIGGGGHIKSLTYYPVRLSNSELQALSK